MATISDLPRDVLVSIFRSVLDIPDVETPSGWDPYPKHQHLRRVCREWRDVADIAFIEYNKNCVTLELRDRSLRNPATVRARFPSLIHNLLVNCFPRGWHRDCWAPFTGPALSSLFSSPDLRRVLKRLKLQSMCCADVVAAAVSTIVACPHLTSLELGWFARWRHGPVNRPDMLGPLGQLTGLEELTLTIWDPLEGSWPALPDSTSLTSLALGMTNHTFAVVGSDAALGLLRRLSLGNCVRIWEDDRWASDDPLYLRADLDAGAWRPHLLTGLQELHISMLCEAYDQDEDRVLDERDWRETHVWHPRVFGGAAPAAAVWAPLAPTVTKLELRCEASIWRDFDLETGMFAGLGELTGLQALAVKSRYGPRFPVDLHCFLACGVRVVLFGRPAVRQGGGRGRGRTVVV